VGHVNEGDLAWALIEAIKPHLTIAERNYVFVAVGAGDTFPAILTIIKIVAAKQLPLRRHLVQQCATLLDAYNVHNEYEHVRHIIDSFVVPTSIQTFAAIRRVPAPPKRPPPPLVVKARYPPTRRPAPRSADSRALPK
jgi:hypothetical protein